MAVLEELKRRLVPLFDAGKGFPSDSIIDPSDSCMLSDGGAVNLLSKSYNIYNINELGLQKCVSSAFFADDSEKTYRCASHEMRIFGCICSGVSSVVHRAIHIPNHRIIALKKINIFEKMLTIHHYLLFDGSDSLWHNIKTLYREKSVFSFGGKEHVGPDNILTTLTSIRRTVAGEWPPEQLVHVVEKLQCRAHGQNGVAIHVTGSFTVGNQFLICGDDVQVEGLPSFQDLSIDTSSNRMGALQEQFTVEASDMIGRYFIAKQELYIGQ